MSHGLMTLLLLLLLLLLLSAVAAHSRVRTSPVIKAGYWPSGRNPSYPPSAIDFPYFTHILYAFVQPDPTSFNLTITPADDTLLANFTATLHAQHPPLKALLSIGGGGSDYSFANIASTRANRLSFITSTISVARHYNLDGLDLDWEFPINPTEMSNLGDLYTEWRHAFEEEAARTHRPRLLLTSAVYFASHFFLSGTPRAYPSSAMSTSLDWLNIMCYDYHGGWDTSETGEHAALYDPKSNISTSYGVSSWLAAGVPAEKVVMGIPLYGRTWKLMDAAVNGVGAPAVGLGPGESDGTMIYSKVVAFNAAEGATVVEDATTGSAYSYAGTSWIGYEDPTSVALKIGFARGMGLGGYFFWALGYDYHDSVSKTAYVAWESIRGTAPFKLYQ